MIELTDEEAQKLADKATVDLVAVAELRVHLAFATGVINAPEVRAAMDDALDNLIFLRAWKMGAESRILELERANASMRASFGGVVPTEDEVEGCLADIEALEKQCGKVMGSNIFLRSWRVWAQSEMKKVVEERDSLRQTILDLRPGGENG